MVYYNLPGYLKTIFKSSREKYKLPVHHFRTIEKYILFIFGLNTNATKARAAAPASEGWSTEGLR